MNKLESNAFASLGLLSLLASPSVGRETQVPGNLFDGNLPKIGISRNVNSYLPHSSLSLSNLGFECKLDNPSPGEVTTPTAPESSDSPARLSSLPSTSSSKLSFFAERALKQVDQDAHTPANALDQLAVERFRQWGKALNLDDSALSEVRVANHGSWVCALSDNWVFTCDLAGNQTFRCVSNYPTLVDAIEKAGPTASLDTTAMFDRVRQIASNIGYPSINSRLPSVVYKRESILVGKPGSVNFKVYDGRKMCRLYQPGTPMDYFQVIFDRDGKTPLRVDCTVPPSSPEEVPSRIAHKLGECKIENPLADNISSGCFGLFYASDENRFRVNAESMSSPLELDPFGATRNYDRDSQPEQFWQVYFWNRLGRVGGIRGNWYPEKSQWEKPNISISMNCLSNYSILPYPEQGVLAGDMDSKFRRDLESCFGAAIYTHSGSNNDGVIMRIEQDRWFKVGTYKCPLGTGALRSLFLYGCNTMDYNAENLEAAHGTLSLAKEWLSGKYVNGLTTVCGYDGTAKLFDRDGWRFFNSYNQGSSIQASWLNSLMTEAVDNVPVTVCYGDNMSEAVFNLADGRFDGKRTTPNVSIASHWRCP